MQVTQGKVCPNTSPPTTASGLTYPWCRHWLCELSEGAVHECTALSQVKWGLSACWRVFITVLVWLWWGIRTTWFELDWKQRRIKTRATSFAVDLAMEEAWKWLKLPLLAGEKRQNQGPFYTELLCCTFFKTRQITGKYSTIGTDEDGWLLECLLEAVGQAKNRSQERR